jgi:hypothetical protein
MGRRAIIEISIKARNPKIIKESLTRSVRIDRSGICCGDSDLEGIGGSDSSSSSSVAVCSAISLPALRNGHTFLECRSVGWV